jgi:hypothetical protein
MHRFAGLIKRRPKVLMLWLDQHRRRKITGAWQPI